MCDLSAIARGKYLDTSSHMNNVEQIQSVAASYNFWGMSNSCCGEEGRRGGGKEGRREGGEEGKRGGGEEGRRGRGKEGRRGRGEEGRSERGKEGKRGGGEEGRRGRGEKGRRKGGEEGKKGGGEEGKRGGGSQICECVQCSVAVSDVEEDGESLSQMCDRVCVCKSTMTTYC